MTDYGMLIRAAAREQIYLTPINLDLLRVQAAGVREGRLSIWDRHIDVLANGNFAGSGRLRFDLLDTHGVVIGQSSCRAEFSGVVDESGAAIHATAVDEL